MHIVCIGGGPGGLYLSVLLKQYHPTWKIEVFERNGPTDTFGFGVVFSDASLARIKQDDPKTYHAITSEFAHWDDIDVHMHGEVRRSSGHGFSGLSRKRLLQILQQRCHVFGAIDIFAMKILRMQLLPHMLPALGRGLSSSVGALIMAQDRHWF